jgi:hypothetical protein
VGWLITSQLAGNTRIKVIRRYHHLRTPLQSRTPRRYPRPLAASPGDSRKREPTSQIQPLPLLPGERRPLIPPRIIEHRRALERDPDLFDVLLLRSSAHADPAGAGKCTQGQGPVQVEAGGE